MSLLPCSEMSLPCCDEDDNGVPDFCLASTHCPFHPHNPYTNDNCCQNARDERLISF